ncbi:MAG: GntR family transcriptional regulator [Proteobacteria bacterium]|nr:GntR family transcriptional regulator [Pseudomonadota bacterium]MBU1449573.1 GntR family transcriptional regulator [Pseudomonadota bacterium]MBU2516870.1 GntR family transcriptional regulator [Pseudomonadota bacterium]
MEQAEQIDSESYEPAYSQLVNILRRQIAAGLFRPANVLPSEAELCRRYKISPMTVRRAINILIDQEVVSTVQGRGTFVKPPELGNATFNLRNFKALFTDKKETTVNLLEVRIVSACQDVADELNIAPGERTIFLRRLILKNGEPIIYHKESLIYDPGRPIVEAEMEVTSLLGLLVGARESYFKKGKVDLIASVLNEEEAALLHAPPNLPAFRLEHVFYDFDDNPVSWGRFICRGDHLRFSTMVGI